MKKIMKFMFVIMLIIPFIVSAETIEDSEIVAESIKYIKTVTIYNNSSVMRNAGFGEISSITTEVTKEEYDNAEPTTTAVAPLTLEAGIQTETTYKRLSTRIYSYGNYFKYTTNLYWKNIPKVRSHDIIAIGHYDDVELYDTELVGFSQDYCRSANNCYTNAVGTDVIGTYGTAVVFKVPSDTLISLEQTLDFIVVKTVNWTVTEQVAAGDYAHATSTISASRAASNLVVNIMGLSLGSTIEDYYDTTPAAIADWEGSW